MFEIRNAIITALLSALMVSYPVFSATVLYIYTLPYYMFAVLLSVIAAYLFVSHGIIKNTVAVLLSVFSLGIYQAYLPVTVTLVLIYFYWKCFENENTGFLLKSGLKIAISITAAVVLYIFIAKTVCSLNGISLNDYKGINSMGEISVYDLLIRVGRTYWYTIGFPFRTFHLVNPNLVSKLGIFISYFVTMILVVKRFLKIDISNRAFTVLLLAITPLCVNLIYIMVPDKYSVNLMMVYSSIGIILLALCLTDKYLTGSRSFIMVGIRRAEFLLTCMLVVEFSWFANGIYTANTYVMKQTDSYFTTLITQIKSLDGYNEDMPVIFIGSPLSEDFTDGTGFEMFGTPGQPVDNPIGSSWALKNYLQNHLGFTPAYGNIDILPEAAKEQITDMPEYPTTGSVAIVSGNIVVKGKS